MNIDDVRTRLNKVVAEGGRGTSLGASLLTLFGLALCVLPFIGIVLTIIISAAAPAADPDASSSSSSSSSRVSASAQRASGSSSVITSIVPIGVAVAVGCCGLMAVCVIVSNRLHLSANRQLAAALKALASDLSGEHSNAHFNVVWENQEAHPIFHMWLDNSVAPDAPPRALATTGLAAMMGVMGANLDSNGMAMMQQALAAQQAAHLNMGVQMQQMQPQQAWQHPQGQVPVAVPVALPVPAQSAMAMPLPAYGQPSPAPFGFGFCTKCGGARESMDNMFCAKDGTPY